jgi:magnesium transporter
MVQVRQGRGGSWRTTDDVARARGATTWVVVESREDAARQAVRLGLPEDVVAKAGSHGPTRRPGRPHVEHLPGDGVYLATPTVTYRGETVDVLTGEVALIALDGAVLTWESGPTSVLAEVASRLEDGEGVTDHVAGGVLGTLLGVLVSEAADVEIAIADAVESLEATVFSPTRVDPVARVYALKREIAEARRALGPLGVELPDLLGDPDGTGPDDAGLRRLMTMVERLDHRLEAHDRLLADMLSAHLSLVSVRQNDDVRRISAWAAIAAAPTLLASVYGMNFEHMPELAWPAGYPLAIGVMVGTSGLLYGLFRRSGWL